MLSLTNKEVRTVAIFLDPVCLINMVTSVEYSLFEMAKIHLLLYLNNIPLCVNIYTYTYLSMYRYVCVYR